MRLRDANRILANKSYIKDVALYFQDEGEEVYTFNDIKTGSLDPNLVVCLYFDERLVDGPYPVKNIAPRSRIALNRMDEVIKKMRPWTSVKEAVQNYERGMLPKIIYRNGSLGFKLPVSKEFIKDLEQISHEEFVSPYIGLTLPDYFKIFEKHLNNLSIV